MPIEWRGEGIEEQGVDASGRTLIEVDPRYFRPTEVDLLLGDASKAGRQLGWKPRTAFRQLVDLMTDADVVLAESEQRARLVPEAVR
jgi:GDPmannose 4,6-dehydratase